MPTHKKYVCKVCFIGFSERFRSLSDILFQTVIILYVVTAHLAKRRSLPKVDAHALLWGRFPRIPFHIQILWRQLKRRNASQGQG